MKSITFITTTASCDDTFDKIEHLNKFSGQEYSKESIIVLRGNFVPDVFVWVENPNNPSFARYCLQQKHHEITEDRYDEMHEVLPPIYLSHIDGEAVKKGFAVSEAYNHTQQGHVVLSCFYKRDGKYYETLCVVFKSTYRPIFDYNAEEWTKDNVGISYIK